MRINNSMAYSMQRIYNNNVNSYNNSINKIATGSRINSAADDASGLAIAEKMNSQLTYNDTVSDNTQDTINMYRVADGALSSVSDITNRMTELSTRASNGTLGAEERQLLQSEFNQLTAEINRIGQSTTFNGKQLFTGQSQTGNSMDTKVGELSAASLGLDQVDLSSVEGAGKALEALRNAGNTISAARGDLGAAENALEHQYNSITNNNVNLAASLSRIMDTDIAKESIEMGISKALNAASLAMMKNTMNIMQSNAVQLLIR